MLGLGSQRASVMQRLLKYPHDEKYDFYHVSSTICLRPEVDLKPYWSQNILTTDRTPFSTWRCCGRRCFSGWCGCSGCCVNAACADGAFAETSIKEVSVTMSQISTTPCACSITIELEMSTFIVAVRRVTIPFIVYYCSRGIWEPHILCSGLTLWGVSYEVAVITRYVNNDIILGKFRVEPNGYVGRAIIRSLNHCQALSEISHEALSRIMIECLAISGFSTFHTARDRRPPLINYA